MTEDVGLFDAGFFNLSADAASAMDPQLRLLLESVNEAFENGERPHVSGIFCTSLTMVHSWNSSREGR
jgi:hypothetical protein